MELVILLQHMSRWFWMFILANGAMGLLQSQSPIDSTRKGFAKGKMGIFSQSYLDLKNGFGTGRYLREEKSTTRLAFPFDSEGYKLIFEDNFDSLNRKVWQVGQPWGRFHAQTPHQYFGDSEVYVKEGILILENRYAPKVFKHADTLLKIPYGTGLINTYYSNQFKYGYFAIRSKNPTGPATWPAFWLTGRDNWPPEIDVFEMYGRCDGKSVNEQTMTLHFGKIETKTKTQVTKSIRLSEDTDSEFHIYSCLWEPGRVTFYTDGVKVRTIKLNGWMNQFYREPMYLLVNNAVDYRFLKCLDNSTLPVKLEVDWIRVYSR